MKNIIPKASTPKITRKKDMALLNRAAFFEW